MAIACTVFVQSFLAGGLIATAQEQRAASAKDVIFARKTLMNAIMDNLDKITEMISQRRIDFRAARDHADNISAMLSAFPHLFPPHSDLWKENAVLDPATDTIASPDIWTDFAAFYRQAESAARTATDLGRAGNEDDFRRLHRALGIACDTCHALYLKEQ